MVLLDWGINITFHQELNDYCLEAWIIRITDDRQPTYLEARALPETVHTYIPHLSETAVKLIHELHSSHPAQMGPRYLSRQVRTLTDLLSNPKTAAPFLQKHYQNTNKILQKAFNLDIPIFIEAVRNHHLSAYMILNKTWLQAEPLVSFSKTQLGIKYSLTLQLGDQIIQLQNHKVTSVSDTPAIVIIDRNLLEIAQINSRKLKPFLDKEYIFIENKHVPTYFQKFIKPLVAKLDVAAEGFSIIEQDKLDGTSIVVFEDLFSNQWKIKLRHQYGQQHFYSNESRRDKTNLHIEDENYRFVKSIRSAAEEALVGSKLQKLGLEENEGIWHLSNANPLGLLEWVIDHKDMIYSEGLNIDPVWNGHQQLILEWPKITENVDVRNDWFDIKATISVGDYTINLLKVIRYIKENQRIMPLGEEQSMLLPQTWFARWQPMVEWAEIFDGKLSLPKTRIGLLGELAREATSEPHDPLEVAQLDYQKYCKATLLPFQLQGVQWMHTQWQQGLGICLADDMGLGKTIQTIALLAHLKQQASETKHPSSQGLQLDLFNQEVTDRIRPIVALLIVPTSLITNWYMEIKKWAPSFYIKKYEGPNRKDHLRQLPLFDVVIMSYDIARSDAKQLSTIPWQAVILDEAQMIRNATSKLFKALYAIPAQKRLILSGTPLENSLKDLWALMHFINPHILGNLPNFKQKYIQSKPNPEDLSALKKLIKPIILRRTKKEVLSDLPELSEQVVTMDMDVDQAKYYDQVKNEVRNYLMGIDTTNHQRPQVLAALTKLRQIACYPQLSDPECNIRGSKIDMVTYYLKQVLEADQQVIIFSSFTQHLEVYRTLLQSEGIAHGHIYGSTAAKDRDLAVSDFQGNKAKVLLLSLKAAGVGLNITKADHVFFLDLWWNPQAEAQAIARAYRIGRDNPVMVTRFVTSKTIEEKILQLQVDKQLLFDQFFGSDVPKSAVEKMDVFAIL